MAFKVEAYRVPTFSAEKFWFWLAWKLPRRLVYFCAVRVIAHATTGKWGGQIVSDLLAMDALKRWEEKQ